MDSDTSNIPQTDEFQVWLFSLFDWQPNGVCQPTSSPIDDENPPIPWDTKSGKFLESCQPLPVGTEGMLEAQCRMLDGNYHYSVMDLRSIILALDGEFHWLDGTAQWSDCQSIDARVWRFLTQSEVHSCAPHPEEITFPVIAQCRKDDGEVTAAYLTLDERITNDNGRLKLLTPLGPLNILPLTDYHASTIAMAMVMAIPDDQRTVLYNKIALKIQMNLESEYLAQSLKSPLVETLDAKAAALLSLMWIKFCRTHTVVDLAEYSNICKELYERKRATTAFLHELQVLLDQYQKMPSNLKRHAMGLVKRAEESRDIPVVNETIYVLRMVDVVIAGDDKHKPLFTQGLCKMLLFRYEATGDSGNLHEAVVLAEGLKAMPLEDNVRKADALFILANCKWEEDKLAGTDKSCEVIVDLLQKAENCSTGHQQWIMRANLHAYLTKNYCTFETFDASQQAQVRSMLEQPSTAAVKGGEEARFSDTIAYWCNRSRILCLAFQADPQDSSLITQAIDCAEKSSTLCRAVWERGLLSPDVFAHALTAHAHALAIQFKITEASDDLNSIIRTYEEASAICGPKFSKRAEIFHTLASHQILRHERKHTQDTERGINASEDQDLLQAVHNARIAYEIPSRYMNPQGALAHTLIDTLIQRCEAANGDPTFLDEGLKYANESLASLPREDGTRMLVEGAKCELLFRRFMIRHCADSYREAFDIARHYDQNDLSKTMDGPRLILNMMRYAMKAISVKADVLKERILDQDIRLVTQQCEGILDLDDTHTRLRAEAGRILGKLYGGLKEWALADIAFGKTIPSFKRLVNRSISRADQEWILKQFVGLPTLASLVAFHATKSAGSVLEEVCLNTLRRLESSRGVLAQLAVQSRLNLRLFQSIGENAATEYESLLKNLSLLEVARDVEDDSLPSDNDNKRRANLIQRRSEIVKQMTELEDALGMREEDISADSLKRLVGKSAFVQVIVSKETSFAILVTDTGLRTVDLPDLKSVDILKNLDRLYGKSRLSKAKPLQVAKAGRELCEVLRWLWAKAVKLILSELGFYPRAKSHHGDRLPRLWWCASGIASKVPFHAAGEGINGTENVFDYAVSSFTTSLAALKMVRGCSPPTQRCVEDGMLAISMPKTPGSGWVPLDANEELGSIKTAANLAPTCLNNPSKNEVVEKLSQHNIIHFICHGTSIASDPSSSALLLGTHGASIPERLTVKELGTINLEKTRIAYLSACSTAENSSRSLSDESIHLASSFQLAGCPHVVGAFWEVKSRGATPLAGFFYQNLVEAVAKSSETKGNHDVVAYALHEALCRVRRDEDTRNPLCWAPVVHIGA